MKAIILRRRVFTVFAVLLMLITLMPQAVWAGQSMQRKDEVFQDNDSRYELDGIYLFYDAEDELMKATADAVYEIASFRIGDMMRVPVKSMQDIEFYLTDKPWIGIYTLKSNLTHVMLPDSDITWQQFYKLLREHRSTRHIVAMGNTLSLEPFLKATDNRIQHSESEQTDGLILIVYAVWELMLACKDRANVNKVYAGAADDLEKMVIKVYADHFTQLLNRNIEPIDPVGQIDPEQAEKRRQKMWEDHQAQISDAAYRLSEDGKLRQVDKESLPDGFEPTITLGNMSQASDDAFILGEIPGVSGLRGPAGKVVDALLWLLKKVNKNVLTIPNNVMEDIRALFEEIKPWIGIVDDFELDSPIKSVIQGFVDEFPVPHGLKPLMDVFAKALFNLRGGPDSFGDIIDELIELVLKAVVPEEVLDFLRGVLDVGENVWEGIQEIFDRGGALFDEAFKNINSNIFKEAANRSLSRILGIGEDISELIDDIQAFYDSPAGLILSGDFEGFAESLGQELLNDALGVLNDVEGLDALDDILSLFEIGFTAADILDMFDDDSVENALAGLVDEVLDGAGMVETAGDIATNLLGVMQTYVELSGIPSIDDFRSDIQDILSTNLTSTVSSDLKGIIEDSVVLLAGSYNDNFNQAEMPDFFEITDKMVGDAYSVATTSYHLADYEEAVSALESAVKPALGIVAMSSGNKQLKEMISQSEENFESELGSMPDVFVDVMYYLDTDGVLEGISNHEETLNAFGEISAGLVSFMQMSEAQSYQGIMQSVYLGMVALPGIHSDYDDLPLNMTQDILTAFFPDSFGQYGQGFMQQAAGPMASTMFTIYLSQLLQHYGGEILGPYFEAVEEVKDAFLDGITWLLSKLYDWLTGKITDVLRKLENAINSALGSTGDLLGYLGSFPFGLGKWSLFELSFDLGIAPNFRIDPSPFFELVRELLFEGRELFSLGTLTEFFSLVFTCFEISPQAYVEFGMKAFDSSKNSIMDHIFDFLGVDLSFSGKARVRVTLFTLRNMAFRAEDFAKLDEFLLSLKVVMEKKISLLSLFTGGLGGSVLSKLGEYIGLGSLSLKIWFRLALDILIKGQTATAPVTSSLSLSVNLGASTSIGIDIIVAAAKLKGSFEFSFSFSQDSAASTPMKILMEIIFTLKLKIRFLFFTDTYKWTWNAGGPWNLAPKKGDAEYKNSGVGFDSDEDGLSDDYEKTIPGLDWNDPDTDDDGANDKLELMVMDTSPTDPDTDDDGLLDGEEWDIGTNARMQDTDWDELTDWEEHVKYGTDPFTQDSDGDTLSDYYEIHHAHDMSGITPTVEYVTIGLGDYREEYEDRTDPLNPDTDGDGLLDGQEGVTGAYYGLDSLYNDTEGSGFDPDPLIFNGGYTHPLDADTDDDSWLQLYSGDIDSNFAGGPKALHPKGTEGQEYPMSDYNEIIGFDIVVYDEDGEPENKHVYTSPVNPDTDGDTGVSPEERENPPAGAWLNSDGYELAQDPPSDPTDGDSDDDGLLDGLEGVLRQDSNHTFYLDPDTDNDGLPDLLDVLLGTDPLSADSDLDMVTDGDEFFFGTDPTTNDTDHDGLSDGWELYFTHSNPLIDDSDGDGLSDGYEYFVTGSDPMDEDSDDDGLTDREEFYVYYTDPFVYDSDGDGLSDGEEINIYNCNPLQWDSDLDSIEEPNALGEMTWPMSDYHEVVIYGTNVTAPDSDLDGLSDSYELYLGSGEIPWMDPIQLDPMSNDTDNDWLSDGDELAIENISVLLYPYQARTIILPYNTSPVKQDTDNDTLIDFQEVVVFNSNPATNDTDNDTLSDFMEIWVYNSSALSNDTDGDGLWDFEETFAEVYPYGSWPPSNWSVGLGPGEAAGNVSGGGFGLSQYEGTYETDGNNWDSDGDWLPDGAEIHLYSSDPLDTDSDGDGYADTYEFDTDYDGLADGVEFQMGLQAIPGGGIMNPDSDSDGLMDGDEVYVYGTDPRLTDTDGDSYSDGLEVALGLDPLVFTSEEDFQNALAIQRGLSTLKIMMPKNGTEVYQDTPVSVANFTPFQEMWFRFENGSDWSEDYDLEYNSEAGQWQSREIRWQPGTYTVRVYARNSTGVVHGAVVTFVVIPGESIQGLIITVAIAAGLIGLVVVVGYVGYRKGVWVKLLSREENYGLELSDIPGVGSALETRLKEGGYSSVSKVASAETGELSKIEGISETKAEDLVKEADELLREAKKDADVTAEEGGE